MLKNFLIFALIFAVVMTQNVTSRYYAQGTFDTGLINAITSLINNNITGTNASSTITATISSSLNSA